MKRRQFTKEFKMSVVHEVEAGLSLAEASRRYEIHANLARKWQELYRENGDRAFCGARTDVSRGGKDRCVRAQDWAINDGE